MNVTTQTIAMSYLGLLFLGAGLAWAIYVTITDRDSPLARAYSTYTRHLDVEFRALFLHEVTGRLVANWQLGLSLAAVVVFVVTEQILALAIIGLIAVAPKVWLVQARAERVTKLEAQIDTFLLALANSLKASPSLGDALGACTLLLRAPIQQELELTMKENQLGVPLDQALLTMAKRVGSQSFASSLSTVLIGRQTGGDLPKILETAAGTLREMARLEGVVRTKTAEGKAQAWVLGVMPPILTGILNWIDPLWLKPLSSSFVGHIVVLVAVVFWVASILAARKILAVDI